MTEYIRGLIGPAGKYSLHTHTAYCDGKNKPEEMIRKALELDFTLLGFSGHGFAPHDDDVCMSPEGEEAYRKEILELREKYRDRLDIRLGLERDFYTEDSIQETGVQPPSDFDYDYIIGSVHYVKKDGVYLSVDDTAEIMERAVEEHFRGSVRDYVECYFATEAQVLEMRRGTGTAPWRHWSISPRSKQSAARGFPIFSEKKDVRSLKLIWAVWQRDTAQGRTRISS